MSSVKELNKEILRTIEDKGNTDTKTDLLQLSSKTNILVKKILLRRFQLEQDLHYLKKMQSKISADEETTHSADNTEFGATKGGIDQVVHKLKTMIQDLDNTEMRREAGASGAPEDTENGIEPGSSTAASVEDVDSASKSGLFDQDDLRTGVKVKVSKIKKISIPEDDEAELEETDLDEEEMQELNMDKRIRLATKKMEEMVKQELRDSGVVPSGIIVKVLYLYIERCGCLMVSALDSGSSCSGSSVGIVLCAWLRHFTLSASLSPGVCINAGVQGSRNTPSPFMLQKPEISAGLMGHLARMQT